MKQKINKICKALSQSLYEREELIKLAILAILAEENIFLLGPPGVAKSLIARRLAQIFKGGKSFEYLMSKFSTPEEIFGPVSISKLKDEDKYERKTANYLPGAEIVFLDEIWKSGPAIQNALLTVMNEKLYRNGEQEEKIKLKGLIAASNELPRQGLGLEALWDRFIVRFHVNNIESEDDFMQFLKGEGASNSLKLSEEEKIDLDEFEDWQKKIKAVELSAESIEIICRLKKSLAQSNKKESPIYVSDRKWKKITGLLKASAFMHGRSKTNSLDCFLIQHCLWDQVEQIDDLARQLQVVIKKYGELQTADFKKLKAEHTRLHKKLDKLFGTKNYAPKVYKIKGREYYKLPGLSHLDFGIEKQYNLISKSDFDKLYDQRFKEISLVNAHAAKSRYPVMVYKKQTGELRVKSTSVDHWGNSSSQDIALEEVLVLPNKAPLLKEYKALEKKIKKEVEAKQEVCDAKQWESHLFTNAENIRLAENGAKQQHQKYYELELSCREDIQKLSN